MTSHGGAGRAGAALPLSPASGYVRLSPGPVSREEALRRLARAGEALEEAKRERGNALLAAVDAGVTWQGCAGALGMTLRGAKEAHLAAYKRWVADWGGNLMENRRLGTVDTWGVRTKKEAVSGR